MKPRSRVVAAFHTAAGRDPDVVAFAPGRVNLIGEHTDYNEGFVLPAALDPGVAVAGRRVPGETFTLHAIDLGESRTFGRGQVERDPGHSWVDYFKGVVWALGKRGIDVPACEVAITGDIPQGAGLSSSAAYEVATVRLLSALGAFELPSVEIAKLAREAENGFVGVAVIMAGTAMASTFGEQGKAVCSSTAARWPTKRWRSRPGSRSWWSIAASATPRLVRVQQTPAPSARRACGSWLASAWACAPCATSAPTTRRASSRGAPTRRAEAMSPPRRPRERLRARSGVGGDGFEAISPGPQDPDGGLPRQPARDDYEVSCAELDVLVGLALALPTCHGARLTGAGFGGSTVNLVDTTAVESFSESVASGYRTRTGRTAEISVFEPSAGARLL